MKQSQRSKVIVRVGALAALALTMAMAASPTQAAWYSWSAWTLNANNPATCTNGGSVDGNSVGGANTVAAWSPAVYGWKTEAQAYPSNITATAYSNSSGWKQTVTVSAPNTIKTRCRIGGILE